MHSYTFFAVASIVTAFFIVCDVRRIIERAAFITVTESILCDVPAEAEERVEHGLHNVYSTACFSNQILAEAEERVEHGLHNVYSTTRFSNPILAEAEERVEHGLHNVYSTTCFSNPILV